MEDVQLIKLPKITDFRGNLSFFEDNSQIPFEINRVYWIYDVPGGEMRGGHAYCQNEEFIIALSGSFDVVISDGKQSKVYHLNRSYKGIYIPKMCWRELENFSTNSVAFIAASTLYDETDYIRDYDEYKKMVK